MVEKTNDVIQRPMSSTN